MSLQEQCLEYIKELETTRELYNYPDFEADLHRFRTRLLDREFRIAVVGEFSSGKSTFINALLGKDILNHATTETTAVITRIVNVAANDVRVNTGLVKLNNGQIIRLNDFKDLKDYTTTLSSKYKVVQDINCVELYVPAINNNADIVIVDTPGLNGMADGHRDVTVDIIKQAHACIYMLQKRGLTDTDIDFIKFLLSYQRNFIFIQNFIDEFHSEEGENADKKVEEQRLLLQKHIFADKPDANFTICGISALLKLASVDLAIPKLYADSSRLLTAEDRESLGNQSNFAVFMEQMEAQFSETNLSKLQYEDAAWALKNWLEELFQYIQREHRHAEEVLQESREYNSIQRLEMLKEKIKSNITKHKQYLDNFIVDKFRDIDKEQQQELEKMIDALENATAISVDRVNDLVELDKIQNNLPELLKHKIDTGVDDSNSLFINKLGALYQLVLAQVSDYSGIKCDTFNLTDIKLDIEKKRENFSEISTRAKILQRQLEEASKLEFDAKRDELMLDQKVKQASLDVANIEGQIQAKEDKKQEQIALLGSRPTKRVYEESYTYYRDREGFWGAIGNFFLGQKKCTGYRTVEDDSKGLAWDSKVSKIKNDAAERIGVLQQEKGAAERILTRLQRQQSQSAEQVARAEQRVKQINVQLEAQQRSDKLAMEKALREFIQTCKDKLKLQIKQYLQDVALIQLKDNMERNVKAQKEYMQKWAAERYDDAVTRKLEWVEQCKLEKAPELRLRLTNLDNAISKLKSILEKMEGI